MKKTQISLVVDDQMAARISIVMGRVGTISLPGAVRRIVDVGLDAIEKISDSDDQALRAIEPCPRYRQIRPLRSVSEADAKSKMLEIIRISGKIGRRDLTRKTQWIASETRSSILTELQSDGHIKIHTCRPGMIEYICHPPKNTPSKSPFAAG